MKTTLYIIETEYLQLINQIEELDGELTPELEEQLEINQEQLQTKTVAYREIIKAKEAYVQTIDNEIKRLQALKKSQGNIVTRLKDRLLDAVKMYGVIEIGTFKFSTRKSTQVIVNAEVNKLPTEFKTIKVTETPDKTAIKKAIQAGQVIEGCELIEVLNLKID